tara:strand:- start:541 stop:1272 length:732 start_codon:yes stop_codon:yes gene_type:complete
MSRVLVIGDSCQDIFVYCICKRLAPEFPVQVLDEDYKTTNDGMAKNVQNNIISLQCKCDIITNDGWENITKTRYVDRDSNYMFIRVDSQWTSNRCDLFDIEWSQYDAVVISDYNKGFLEEEDIEYVYGEHNCIFMDTKKPLGNWAKGATFIKINDSEYINPQNIIDNELHNKLIHTVGPRGCFYREKQFPVKAVDVKDVSGAGDTFLAGLVVKYLDTNDIERAIKYANKCSTAAVQKKGISTA